MQLQTEIMVIFKAKNRFHIQQRYSANALTIIWEKVNYHIKLFSLYGKSMLHLKNMHIFRPRQNTCKVSKNTGKNTGGVAFTRYPVLIYASVEAEPKLAKFNSMLYLFYKDSKQPRGY